MEKYGLKKVLIPEDPKEETCGAPIFMTSDIKENKSMVVLIQGTGDVRAGIWARSVCMNDKLSLGSVFPQIDYAKEKGYSVIVFNPNFYSDEEKIPVDNRVRGMD